MNKWTLTLHMDSLEAFCIFSGKFYAISSALCLFTSSLVRNKSFDEFIQSGLFCTLVLIFTFVYMFGKMPHLAFSDFIARQFSFPCISIMAAAPI